MLPHPPSPSRSLSLMKLMLLALCLTIVLVVVVVLIANAISYAREASFNWQPNKTRHRKLGKRKPPPLDLGKDLEAQARPSRQRNSFEPLATLISSTSSDGSDNENAMATGIILTPFTPALERTRRWAFGEADGTEIGNVDEEDWLGLDQYFFEDGVGIKRYESGAKTGRWKDEG